MKSPRGYWGAGHHFPNAGDFGFSTSSGGSTDPLSPHHSFAARGGASGGRSFALDNDDGGNVGIGAIGDLLLLPRSVSAPLPSSTGGGFPNPTLPRFYSSNYHFESPGFLAGGNDDLDDEPEEFWSSSLAVVDSLFDDEEDDPSPVAPLPDLGIYAQYLFDTAAAAAANARASTNGGVPVPTSSSPRIRVESAKKASSGGMGAGPTPTAGGSISLDQLEDRIHRAIGVHLGEGDLGRLQATCKSFSVYGENDLWKNLYIERWSLREAAYHGAPSEEWVWTLNQFDQIGSWKALYRSRHQSECWKIGTLKMFNGCWGFISQTSESSDSSFEEPSDIFFHRKDINEEGPWVDDWWLKDTAGVSRSQKCGYWDTFLCGRKVRYKQRAAYAKGRRPQACQISFISAHNHADVSAGAIEHAMPRHIATTHAASYASKVAMSPFSPRGR